MEFPNPPFFPIWTSFLASTKPFLCRISSVGLLLCLTLLVVGLEALEAVGQKAEEVEEEKRHEEVEEEEKRHEAVAGTCHTVPPPVGIEAQETATVLLSVEEDPVEVHEEAPVDHQAAAMVHGMKARIFSGKIAGL